MYRISKKAILFLLAAVLASALAATAGCSAADQEKGPAEREAALFQFDGDADLGELSKPALVDLTMEAMQQASMLVRSKNDEAISFGDPHHPDLLAAQSTFGELSLLLDRIIDTEEGDTAALEAEYAELRSLMGL